MKKLEKILVIVDADKGGTALLEKATHLARIAEAELTIGDVARDLTWMEFVAGEYWSDLQERIVAAKKEQLNELCAELRERGLTVRSVVFEGVASDEIVREVVRGDYDLVMKDAKGEAWYKGFFGATGIQLLRKCPCPVWLGRPDDVAHPGRVVAAVNATCGDEKHAELNERILDYAVALAKLRKAPLCIVQSWTLYGEEILRSHMPEDEFEALVISHRRKAQEALDRLLVDTGLKENEDVQVELLMGSPEISIPQYAHESDVVVLGTIARGGVAGALMGNTAEAIVGQLRCSLLALKPADFVSPIGVDSAVGGEIAVN